jgi:hypothetical protein
MNNETQAPTTSPKSTLAPSLPPSLALLSTVAPLSSGDRQVLVIAVLVGFIFFLAVMMIALLAPNFLPQQNLNQHDRVQRRNQTIKDWLITKPVQQHSGETCQTSFVKHASGNMVVDDNSSHHQPEHSVHTDDEEEDCHDPTTTDEAQYTKTECQICMEEFQVGDMVSWSFCRHVYHQKCIQEWLLQHKGCPYCRRTMLIVDRKRAMESSSLEVLMLKQRRQDTTFFCVQHGLIVTTEKSKRNLEKSGPIAKDFVYEPPLEAHCSIPHGTGDD